MNLSVGLIAGAFDTEDASFAYELSGIQGSGPITYAQNVVSVPEPSLILGVLGVVSMGMIIITNKNPIIYRI
ncbi:PEP-CTERM sorting domain-containing protein [Gloeothece verrucosa]|uniref:PEP-CTERM sorting domain-containing protein n=1 Tax=Gloeothece verrucosa TaxID=2546359 RepID=UPI00017E256F|nr:PEP-CTERM sorting domain-containing protein [Gloeothece verrucosa]